MLKVSRSSLSLGESAKIAVQCSANHLRKAAYEPYTAQAQLSDAGFNTSSLVCCNKGVVGVA